MLRLARGHARGWLNRFFRGVPTSLRLIAPRVFTYCIVHCVYYPPTINPGPRVAHQHCWEQRSSSERCLRAASLLVVGACVVLVACVCLRLLLLLLLLLDSWLVAASRVVLGRFSAAFFLRVVLPRASRWCPVDGLSLLPRAATMLNDFAATLAVFLGPWCTVFEAVYIYSTVGVKTSWVVGAFGRNRYPRGKKKRHLPCFLFFILLCLGLIFQL